MNEKYSLILIIEPQQIYGTLEGGGGGVNQQPRVNFCCHYNLSATYSAVIIESYGFAEKVKLY